MTTSQFFVYKRPVAWTALVATLGWGYFAYRAMPQQHDPVIPIRIATIVTIYPGADADKVEQEVTRKIERQVSQSAKVEKVHSLSRQSLSVVFVELFESVKDAEVVWQDLEGRLQQTADLPTVAGPAPAPATKQGFRRDRGADAYDLQSQGVGVRNRRAGQEHSRDLVVVSRRSASAIPPRPGVGDPGLSEHRGAFVRGVDGEQPHAAAFGAGGDRGCPFRRSSEHWVPGFSTRAGKDRRRPDPRIAPVGTRVAGHRRVASRHVAGDLRPRTVRAGGEAALQSSRYDAWERSIQLPRLTPVRRRDPRPAEAVSDRGEDRRDRSAAGSPQFVL